MPLISDLFVLTPTNTIAQVAYVWTGENSRVASSLGTLLTSRRKASHLLALIQIVKQLDDA